MVRDAVIARLREHEPELRAAGVVSLSMFGSVARGDERADSDVDLLARFTDEVARDVFAYFGRVDALTHRLQDILGRPVDVVAEPVRATRLRLAIKVDSTRAF